MSVKSKITKNTKDAVLFFMRQHSAKLAVVAVLGLLYGLMECVSIGMLMPVLHQMIGQSENVGEKGRIVSYLFLATRLVPGIHPLISALFIFFIATLLKNIIGYAREILSVFIGLSTRENCQASLFQRLLRSDYRFFLRQRQGDLQYRVITAPNQMGNFITLVPDLATELIKCLFIFVLLVAISAQMSLLIAVIGGIFFGIVRFMASRISYYTGSGRATASSDMTVYCGQILQGIKMIRVFKAEKSWEDLFKKSLNKFYRLARKDTIFLSLPSKVLEVIAIGILCFVVGWILSKNSLEQVTEIIPALGVFALALQRLIPSFNAIGRHSMQFMSLVPYCEASYEAIVESGATITQSGGLPAIFEHEICFKDVTLKYESEEKEALKKINITFAKGSFTAIVGKSGSGKTSIVNLLLGIISPTIGQVLIDGVPLEKIDKSKWFDKIGYVGQEMFMFHGTIRDNILFGAKGVSDKQIYKALEMANALEFVEQCSEKLDTVVSDEGLNFSGGQRQRLSIARALIRDPDILVFDEATSSLDAISEKSIKNTIKKLSQNKTIIIIAHSTTTISDARDVVMLRDGEVVDKGYRYLANRKSTFK